MNNVIAEIGLNHGGDLKVAKLLIKQAKDAGCWGVKFQYRNIGSFYHKLDEVGDTMIYDEIKRNHITIDDLIELSMLCKELSVNFGVSLFRLEDLLNLRTMSGHIDFFKVPSPECLNVSLLKELLKESKKVFVSSGAHATDDILNVLGNFKNEIILLHCISNYPTSLGTQDLHVISTYLANGFSEVGYSSHDENWEVCLMAFCQGAKWIERHITVEKDSNGLDHSSSSDLGEFKKLVAFANNFENILGERNRVPNQGELINLQNLGTSLYANELIKVGQQTTIDNYTIRAPRVGISPAQFEANYQKIKLNNELKQGSALSISNFSIKKSPISHEIRSFAKQRKLGLPVRLHDYSAIKKRFDLATYEFHLSFSEVLNDNLMKVIDNINQKEHISIHLPDYIPGNNLLDPLSRDYQIKTISRKMIETVGGFAKAIEDKISKKVNIVGSFSKCHHDCKKLNLDAVFDYIENEKLNILPQWLPVYAWYFGGTVKLDIFNSYQDIQYIVSNQRKICLDFSHLVMAASYYKVCWRDWFNDLLPCAEHIHISDAADATSEGLMFGKGQIGDFSEILAINKLKIIESWQGHINEGEGFGQALGILYRQSKKAEDAYG